MVNSKEKDKNITTLIRDLDAKSSEIEVAKEVAKEHWEWVDVIARHCFGKGVGVGTLKCARGFNHHGTRNRKTNKEIACDRYPCCNEVEN